MLSGVCVCLWSQVLGTPTREQIREMNPNYTEFKFPQIKAHPWTKVSKQVQDNCFSTSSTAALHLQPSARLIVLTPFHSHHPDVCTTQASPPAFHLVFFDTYFSTMKEGTFQSGLSVCRRPLSELCCKA